MGLLGILAALGLLIWFSFRGWSVLLLAPVVALFAAATAGEPLLAHWTQTFMVSAAAFVAQFFPIFLLGAYLDPFVHGDRALLKQQVLNGASAGRQFPRFR